MIKEVPIITIDGPSGSGKGAISKLLSEQLGWHLLDSGAIYRVLALVAIKRKIPLDDIPALVRAGKDLNIKFVNKPQDPQKITLGDKDVTLDIRREECGVTASKISGFSEIRSLLISYQRDFCRSPGLVADGRDMGTVVFPDARLKIFLTATDEERANRRLLQLHDQGINASLGTVLQDLKARDDRDYNRAVAPLKPASGAVIIDTTKLSIDEVLQQILGHVKSMH